MLDAIQGRDTSVRDTISKGRFVQGAQHPRIFGRGNIGRGHINPASNKARRLFRPRSIHLCHEKPNTARETVPSSGTESVFYLAYAYQLATPGEGSTCPYPTHMNIIIISSLWRNDPSQYVLSPKTSLPEFFSLREIVPLTMCPRYTRGASKIILKNVNKKILATARRQIFLEFLKASIAGLITLLFSSLQNSERGGDNSSDSCVDPCQFLPFPQTEIYLSASLLHFGDLW